MRCYSSGDPLDGTKNEIGQPALPWSERGPVNAVHDNRHTLKRRSASAKNPRLATVRMHNERPLLAKNSRKRSERLQIDHRPNRSDEAGIDHERFRTGPKFALKRTLLRLRRPADQIDVEFGIAAQAKNRRDGVFLG